MNKILYIFSSDEYGGAEILTETLINQNMNNIRPFIICPNGPFKERLMKSGHDVLGLDSFKRLNRSLPENRNILTLSVKFIVNSLSGTFELLKLIKTKNITIVHANNLNAASKVLIAVILSKTILKPFYLHLEWVCGRHEAKYISKIDRIFNWVCINFYDCVICVSKHVASEMQRNSLQKNKIKLVYNGIDCNRFVFDVEKRHFYRNQFGFKNDEIVIALVGRISKEKGAHLIYEAFCRLVHETMFTNCKLILIGSLQNGIETIIDKISLNFPSDIKKKIILLDKTDEISSLYSAVDIVVNTSLIKSGESFGLTIAEAMACKRIVLGVKVGGLTEVINHGENGFLCEPENVDNLVEALSSILSKWDELDHIKENARTKIVENFSLQSMIDKYNKVYKSFASSL